MHQKHPDSQETTDNLTDANEQYDSRYDIKIEVSTRYMDAPLKPNGNHHAFAYHIRITNQGSHTAQLLTRHWLITNSEGEVQEVHGDGVVGEQPVIQPGHTHSYSSGTWLTTSLGFMQGHFGMKASDGHEFKAIVAPFTLAAPGTLH